MVVYNILPLGLLASAEASNNNYNIYNDST